MRLDKFLGHSTRLSRTQCRRAIKAGAVTLNGVPVQQAATPVGNTDQVCLNDEPLALPQPRYYMLHKPLGYVCANSDGETPTVMDILPIALQDLAIAGRLDKDTSGLVLLSDDGQWIHRVTSPRHHCHKHYRVTVDKTIDADTIASFANGLLLRSEKKPTAAAQLIPDPAIPNPDIAQQAQTAEVIISEGRYHQVKRMFAACGYRVLQLHRHQIGSVKLDAQLTPGSYRPLTANEINGF